MSRFTRNARAVLVATLAALALLAGVANAKDGAYRVIHNFNGSDGCEPLGVPATAKNGNLYGVTDACGSSGYYGTVFKLTAPQSRGGMWKETVLYNFTSEESGNPGALVMGNDGTLYGKGDSENNPGFIFRLRPPVEGGAGSMTCSTRSVMTAMVYMSWESLWTPRETSMARRKTAAILVALQATALAAAWFSS